MIGFATIVVAAMLGVFAPASAGQAASLQPAGHCTYTRTGFPVMTQTVSCPRGKTVFTCHRSYIFVLGQVRVREDTCPRGFWQRIH